MITIELINKINNPFLSDEDRCEWFNIVRNVAYNECRTHRIVDGVKLTRAAMLSDGCISNLTGIDFFENSEVCLEKSVNVVDVFYKFTKDNNIKTGYKNYENALNEILDRFNWVDDLPIIL